MSTDTLPPEGSVLHLVSSPDAATEVLAVLGVGDRVVFINEGVTALQRAEFRNTLANLMVATADGTRGPSNPVGILAEHAALFGIDPPPGLQPLSMSDLVEQVVACRSSVTWC